MNSAKLPGSVLTFLPRRLDQFFAELSDRTFVGRKHFFCYRRGIAGYHVQRDFYKHYNGAVPANDLSEEDYRQIILRDRVLKYLPNRQARRMVDAMYAVMDELIDRVRPDYALSVMVDHYMLDLLARLCHKKGTRVVMFGAGSLANTITVTAYGEFNKVRNPPEDEIERAVDRLLDDGTRITYATPFNGYTARKHFAQCLKWWAKCAYFNGTALLTRDPLNYRKLLATLPQIISQSSPFSYRCMNYFHHDWEHRLSTAIRPAILFPLGYTPEATTDYWLSDLRYVDYRSFVISAAKSLSEHYQVVIKEHWASLGHRPWQFYEQLRSIPGVVLVPGEVKGREVMSRVERVLVGSGTPGIEAAIRGKKVVTLDRPYYHLDGCYLNLMSVDRIRELPHLLENFQRLPNTRDTQRAIARRMLEATLTGTRIPAPCLNTEENFQTASNALRSYLGSSSSETRPAWQRRMAG